MTIVAGPFAIAALLLVVGGALKVRRPGDTVRAMQGLKLPSSPMWVRILAAVEMLVGIGALGWGERVSAVGVAVSYAGFTAFVGLAIIRGAPIATCGCFGRDDTAPNLVHVALDVCAVAVSIVVVLDPGVGLPEVVRTQPLAGLPYLGLVLGGVYAAFLAFTSLGSPRSDRRRPSPG